MNKAWTAFALAAGVAAAQPAWAAGTVYIDSPTGDYIGQGQELTFTDVSTTAAGGGERVTLTFSSWRIELDAPFAEALAAGNYEGAARWPFNSSTQPGLSVTSPGRGCNQVQGWFVVHEAAFSGSTVVKLAADLLHSCDGMPPLFAAVRVNSAVALHRPEPYARARPAQVADEGETVTLDGSQSFDRATAVTLQWQQTGGTPVELAGATGAYPTFTAPDVPVGGAEFTFELTVEDASGNTDSATATVTVHDPQDLRTRVFLDSDAGDWVGQGLTYWYDETDAAITGSIGTAIAVTVDGSEQWWADFALPSGGTWAPGMYAGAERYPFQLSSRPGLDFSGEGRGCNTLGGWFEIVELQAVGSSIMKLAVDFVQHCEGGTPALFGAIRINSNVPLQREVPYAVAFGDGIAGEGESVVLDGSASASRSGELAYQWTQTGGTPVAIQDATSAIAAFVAPQVAPGGETLTFVLTVTDAAGHADSITVTMHVADGADPRTRAYIDSPAGDWIGGGAEHTFSAPDHPFAASAGNGGTYVSITFADWRAEFEAPSGRTLAPGSFENATRYPFNAATSAGLSIGSPGRGCNQLSGWFEVHEAVFSGSTVTRFAVDFMQSCDGGPPLFGAIRINSALPLQTAKPYARPAAPGVAIENQAVTLDGSGSFDRSGTIAGYAWTQLAGPAVGISGADSAQAAFTAPPVSTNTVLTFQLVVTDDEGNSDAATVSVTVYDEAGQRTRAALASEFGDYIGQGLAYAYDESNATIAATVGSAIAVRVNGSESWSLDLALPQGGSWQPGTYALAQRYPFQSPRRPGLSFSGEGRGCNQLLGWFEIIEVQIVGNSVTRLAVDFRQHCEAREPALFGAIRINSTVPLDRNVPYAIAGADIVVREGQPIELDGRWSYGPSGNDLAYTWRQTGGAAMSIEDPNGATTAVVPPAGSGRYTFALDVTDGPGSTDTDEVVVVVRGRDEPQTWLEFEGNDYIGAGRQWSYTTDTADFTISRNYDGGITTSVDGDTWWTLDVAPVDGQSLQVGNHPDAQRYPFQAAGHPGLSLHGDGRGCNTLTGDFRVLQLAFELDGSVRTAAIDFEQHCEGWEPATRGKLRINFRPDNEPLARAGADQDVEEGDTAVLDGTGSTDLQGPIGFAWRQTGGRAVELSAATTASPSFVAPAVAEGIAETYTFALTVTDADGFTAEDSVRVRVFKAADSDGDGVSDIYDAFPADPDETLDTDEDGEGDNGDTDDDADGKPDSTEQLAPNAGDGDNDGTPDRLQANVASFVDMSGALVTLRVDGGTLLWAQAMSNPAPDEAPRRMAFERGFFGFELLVTPGGAATVEMWLHSGVPPQHYFKYGAAGFFEFAYNGATGAEIGAGSIVLHLVDGARGDSDGEENGHIVDPGAPAWSSGAADSGGSGGGGSMPGAALLLLATLAARRRRAG